MNLQQKNKYLRVQTEFGISNVEISAKIVYISVLHLASEEKKQHESTAKNIIDDSCVGFETGESKSFQTAEKMLWSGQLYHQICK